MLGPACSEFCGLADPSNSEMCKKYTLMTWRCGVVAIVNVTGTEDSGFESRLGLSFKSVYVAMLFFATQIRIFCIRVK
jgi:hypothetical protein